MVDPGTPVFTRERVLTFALAILTLIALYVCFKMVEPFVPALAFALALAVATNRPFQWIKRRVRNRTAAAAVAVICVALLIVVPITVLMGYLVQAAIDNINQLRSGGGLAGLRATLEQKPVIGKWFIWIEERLKLQEQLAAIGQAVAGQAGGVLAGSVSILTSLAVTLFLLFFFYRDGRQARHSLRRVLPLSPEEADEMFDRLANTIQATVNGSIIVAVVQALAAGLIYTVLGVPLPALWGALTFFTAFVPVFGTSLIWIPIALYLLLTGAWIKTIILVAWAAMAIGSVDNLLYPFLVGDRLRLHTVPTFFAVLGGVAYFGPVGLILGPITLAIAVGLLDVWWRRMESGQPAESALAATPSGESPATGIQ